MVLQTIKADTVRAAALHDARDLSCAAAPTLRDVQYVTACPACAAPLAFRPTRADPDRLVCEGRTSHEWTLGVSTERGVGGSTGYPVHREEPCALSSQREARNDGPPADDDLWAVRQ